MTAFPKYPKYKDSGLEWLGEVPEHWEISRSRRVFTQRKELARKDDQQLSATQAYGVIPQADYEERIGRHVVKISMHLEKRRHVEPDDFVISMRSFQGGLERAWARGAIRSSYTVLEPAIKVAPSYFAYLFKCPQYIGALQSTGNFIRDGQDLTYQNYILVDLPLPPLAEQERIGAFLDEKTAEIDRLIAKKQRQIELLDEQKAILINRAVTRGLHPQAELQDSGIPWIGPIPKHWKVLPFRRLIDSICDGPFGSGLTSAHYTDAGTRVIRLGNIGKAAFKDDDKAFISPVYAKQLVHHSVHRGDLLVAGLGDGNHPVGRACIYESDEEAIVKADCYRVRLNDQRLNRYVCHYLSSRAGAAGFAAQTRGSTRSRVNLEITREVPVVVPDATEADEIASFIVALSADFLRASSTIESQIQTLQTLRSTLIAHAVTGKIAVPAATV